MPAEVGLSAEVQDVPQSKTDPRFRVVPRNRLSDRVAQEIRDLIAAGKLAAGEMLPGERRLAAMMKVSRVSLRTALEQLRAQGLIESVPGGGTRVASGGPGIGASASYDSYEELRALIELRAGLETWAVRLAAERADRKALAEIQRALLHLADPERSALQKSEDDRRFHQAIAEATGNPAYLRMLRLLHADMERIFVTSSCYDRFNREEEAAVLAQHYAIFEAIAAHDAERAAAAMVQHIERAMNYLKQLGKGARPPIADNG